ncbi:MAG: CoA-binding protein [Bacteroidetes bacterium]|nr:CoA-binding protein [Bacteroidota bacterium]
MINPPSSTPVLVLGAHPDPSRYAYKAAVLLLQKGYSVQLNGIRTGSIQGIPIQPDFPISNSIHTVTLYINAQRSNALLQELIALKPKRIIFNPGTENPALAQALLAAGIQIETACTLVLLHTGQF